MIGQRMRKANANPPCRLPPTEIEGLGQNLDEPPSESATGRRSGRAVQRLPLSLTFFLSDRGVHQALSLQNSIVRSSQACRHDQPADGLAGIDRLDRRDW
jgi:hypothetical protein